MNRYHSVFVLILIAVVGLHAPLLAQSVSWTDPLVVEPGGTVVIRYDVTLGTIPGIPGSVELEWGIDETGSGEWTLPPQSMRPAGSHMVDGVLRTPMTDLGDNIWSITITTLETIESVHYNVVSGTNVDDNSGESWDIVLRTPIVEEQPHLFIFDPRSSRLGMSPDGIEEVYLAGPFNNWSTSADRMIFREEYNYYTYELNLPVGETLYKFVVNGEVWTKDPDNPYSEGVDNDNSIAVVAPYQRPVFTRIRPVDQLVVEPGSSITFQAYVRPSGYSEALNGEPMMTIDGEVADFTWVPTYGLMFRQLALEEGIHTIVLSAEDDIGLTASKTMIVAFHDPADGYLSVDLPGDDKGSGTYRYPENLWGSADLLSFSLDEANGGEAIEFTIALNWYSSLPPGNE